MSDVLLEETIEAPPIADSRQLVAFLIGSEEYAVDITCVQEIIRYTAPRPVPGTAPGVDGVINLRGQIIPVVEVRRMLGSYGEPAEDSKIVVVDVEGTRLGVEVDAVSEVLTVSAADCQAPPEGMAAASDAIDSVVELDGRLLVILNLAPLFPGVSHSH